MNNATTTTSEFEKGVARSTRQLAVWTAAWVITLAVATFGSILLWDNSLSLKVASIALNFAVGIGAIRANIQHLQSLDELMQKVHLQAMGMAMGVSIVAGLTYSVLETAEVISFRAEIAHVVAVTGLVYGIGTFIGMRRYQ